jgi:hypothetical protein
MTHGNRKGHGVVAALWKYIPQDEREDVAALLVSRVKEYEGLEHYSLVYTRFMRAAAYLLAAPKRRAARAGRVGRGM